jgi:hypothetical protein
VLRWITKTFTSQDHEAQAHARGTQLLGEAREELIRADVKAQVFLGVAGVGIGTVTGGILAGSWSPSKLHTSLQWIWWVGAVCALTALFCLSSAVYPRITKRALGISYFGDAGRYRSASEIADALRSRNGDDIVAVSEQIRSISAIVVRKYLLVRWGFWLLLVSIGSTVGSAAIQLAL